MDSTYVLLLQAFQIAAQTAAGISNNGVNGMEQGITNLSHIISTLLVSGPVFALLMYLFKKGQDETKARLAAEAKERTTKRDGEIQQIRNDFTHSIREVKGNIDFSMRDIKELESKNYSTQNSQIVELNKKIDNHFDNHKDRENALNRKLEGLEKSVQELKNQMITREEFEGIRDSMSIFEGSIKELSIFVRERVNSYDKKLDYIEDEIKYGRRQVDKKARTSRGTGE
jgi:hypothetical protein